MTVRAILNLVSAQSGLRKRDPAYNMVLAAEGLRHAFFGWSRGPWVLVQWSGLFRMYLASFGAASAKPLRCVDP